MAKIFAEKKRENVRCIINILFGSLGTEQTKQNYMWWNGCPN